MKYFFSLRSYTDFKYYKYNKKTALGETEA